MFMKHVCAWYLVGSQFMFCRISEQVLDINVQDILGAHKCLLNQYECQMPSRVPRTQKILNEYLLNEY